MTTEQPLTGQVADRLHGFVVFRSESLVDAEEIDTLNKRIRSSLIGCTASQLEDILRSIERIKDLSSTQETIDG